MYESKERVSLSHSVSVIRYLQFFPWLTSLLMKYLSRPNELVGLFVQSFPLRKCHSSFYHNPWKEGIRSINLILCSMPSSFYYWFRCEKKKSLFSCLLPQSTLTLVEREWQWSKLVNWIPDGVEGSVPIESDLALVGKENMIPDIPTTGKRAPDKSQRLALDSIPSNLPPGVKLFSLGQMCHAMPHQE